MSVEQQVPFARVRSSLRLDFPGGSAQPGVLRFLAATVVAVLASIAACWVVATAMIAAFPSTAGYEHFQFGDYTRLTVIGIVLASAAWPVSTLVSTRARRLFFWLTVVVTIVSFAPDFWILRQGQPFWGVVGLIIMHVAVAVITYPVLVFGAPQRRRVASGQ